MDGWRHGGMERRVDGEMVKGWIEEETENGWRVGMQVRQ
jgi:hypothetical protein